MNEFYIHGYTFPAPFIGDTISRFVEAETVEEALTQVADEGFVWHLEAYPSSDAFHKGHTPLREWGSKCYQVYKAGGDWHTVPDDQMDKGEILFRPGKF